MSYISRFDLDVFSDAVTKRVKDFEYTAKKYSKESKESTKRAEAYKERALKLRHEAHTKIAVRDFKEGDLALFLPTRGGQVKGAWAAFNIVCPHYFLAERDGMRLGTRDFIVARIQKVEQKVVDLSRTTSAATAVASRPRPRPGTATSPTRWHTSASPRSGDRPRPRTCARLARSSRWGGRAEPGSRRSRPTCPSPDSTTWPRRGARSTV